MAARRAGARDVIVYELNEVPWEIVDLYLAERPGSNVAKLVDRGQCETTLNEDPNPLQPWRTWPTFHKGVYSDVHKSLNLGQDPSTFRGENVWDRAEAAGLKIGVFGALQSWPPHEPRNGGFYVPDTFSHTADVHPPSLRRFQEFNLAMTKENTFSPTARLDARRVVTTGLDMLARGFTPWSAYRTVQHLARERRDGRYKACRSMVQALPSFDLYWRLHTQTRPNLSIFFTNHLAGMMHRYWGDTVPEYSEQFGYQPDDVYRRFIIEAMDIFDHQLGRIFRFLDRNREYLLIVASSMGQGAIPYRHVERSYVLEQPDRLAAALALGTVEQGLAMYPRTALLLATPELAEDAARAIAAVTCADEPMFKEIDVDGRSVSFAINYELEANDLGDTLAYGTIADPADRTTAPLEQLGISTAPRMGGANTAYHTPEGVLIRFGHDVAPDPSRATVSVLQAAPTILDLLGVGGAAPAGVEDVTSTLG